MVIVNATKLRRHLASYLDVAAHGESLLITVRGKVVARLVPEQDPAETALTHLQQLRHDAVVGDVITPLGMNWGGDSEHV